MFTSFPFVAFIIIFSIAVITILFNTISSLVLSRGAKHKPNKARRYTGGSNDDFMRQAQMMHDMAHNEHIRQHQEFMNASISMHTGFANDMNMHNM